MNVNSCANTASAIPTSTAGRSDRPPRRRAPRHEPVDERSRRHEQQRTTRSATPASGRASGRCPGWLRQVAAPGRAAQRASDPTKSTAIGRATNPNVTSETPRSVRIDLVPAPLAVEDLRERVVQRGVEAARPPQQADDRDDGRRHRALRHRVEGRLARSARAAARRPDRSRRSAARTSGSVDPQADRRRDEQEPGQERQERGVGEARGGQPAAGAVVGLERRDERADGRACRRRAPRRASARARQRLGSTAVAGASLMASAGRSSNSPGWRSAARTRRGAATSALTSPRRT